jgi:hypothetical protein
VDSNFDRDIIEALITARRILGQKGIALSAAKPLFDWVTPDGAVRPSWTITLAQGESAVTGILEPCQQYDEDNRRRRALGFIGPIIDVDAETLPYLTANLTALWESRAP